MVNECIPYFEPGTRLPASVLAGKTVVGKRFVVVGGSTQSPLEGLNTAVDGGNIQIQPAAAKDPVVLGVASHDAAAGDKVTVLCAPMVVPVLAGGNITAGERVGVGAEGKAVKAEDPSKAEIEEGKGTKVPAVGLAVNTVESGSDVGVQLF